MVVKKQEKLWDDITRMVVDEGKKQKEVSKSKKSILVYYVGTG
jgi:hypothetical protein